MAASPPISPTAADRPRPMSAMIRSPRSNSRMSTSSKPGGSRASDEDAKTSVKVAVRVRPPLTPSDPGFELIPQRFQKSMVQVLTPTSLAVDSPQGRKLFIFDKVFGADIQQDGIWEYVSDSVSSFMQGYNVSVMAYGQSGAGKSFTMGTSGPLEQGNKQLMGVIPRAGTALFSKLKPTPSVSRNGSGVRTPNRYSMSALPSLAGSKSEPASDKTWQLHATYVEIYNEQLRDLLVPESVPPSERGAVTIREDPKGRILLTGLRQVAINSFEDLMNALNFGSAIRQTDSTAINAKSSRSHAVFSLNLVQRKNKALEVSARDKRFSMPVDSFTGADSWVTVDSKLHFVDLAGSERLKNTGASGERAKEGISINAGLASLGKVISQLSSRQAGAHVSYRDSKLTRLLQDSLGGNAITYMIACVTPVEFHLSETLNTVQYAQRARAIQSKPKIQQVSDDGDKQALIDRLRAEISFLRDQIRNSERGDHVGGLSQPSERQNEREIELQNHLLDVQENYSALSQRHAKLISEITKSRDQDLQEASGLAGPMGETASERLKRSTQFADAAEQVVLEYEKTIQSLEATLSNIRSSLSSTESTLLEKETKCAYVETMNQQLQNRIQKLIDRESSTEQYLHDLEAKLDGRTVGEEKNSAMTADLRKEVSRLRENEATAEEYISTLEERLAEADQDVELMNREISRLEHVVERQRSVGKLDNLLYELDHSQKKESGPEGNAPLTNGVAQDHMNVQGRKRHHSEATLKMALQTPIPESDEEDAEALGDHPPVEVPETPGQKGLEPYVQSPAQSKFVEEKLETVNQELFDLRVEHESTINEYDLLSAKYEEALRTLATLQEADDSRRSPQSSTPFLSDARVNELKNAGQSSSSRSLSSELSSVGELPTTSDSYENDFPVNKEISIVNDKDSSHDSHDLVREIEELKSLNAQKDEGYKALQKQYDSLREQQEDTMDLVEDLKTEIQKTRMGASSSPTFLRRKSSQNLMTLDRAHRSLASLGNLAAEKFASDPEAKSSFELNMGAVMHELHQRSERVQVLEGEIASVKKEMETKMTIISGLTRERTSLKTSSPVDMTMISSMRDQILQREDQLRLLQKQSTKREQGLTKEIDALKISLSDQASRAETVMPGGLPDTPGEESTVAKELAEKQLESREDLDRKISELQVELSTWETKHQSAMQSMQASEKKLLATIAELEGTLTGVDAIREARTKELDSLMNSTSAAAAAFDLEREKHQEVVSSLNKEIARHKTTIENHESKIVQLQKQQALAQEQMEAAQSYRDETVKNLDLHRDQISALEEEIEKHQAAVEFHKHGLMSLHDSHAAALEDTRASTRKDVEEEMRSRVQELSAKHREEMDRLYEKIKELDRSVSADQPAPEQSQEASKDRTSTNSQPNMVNGGHSRSTSGATDGLAEAQTKLKLAEKAQSTAEDLLAKTRARVEELTLAKSELNDELISLREKEQRASRLVEELEGQLSSTFEDSRKATSRLSLMQSTREQEIAEARAATSRGQEEAAMLRNRIEQLESQRGRISPNEQTNERTSSMTSNFRKTNPVTTLPSPPPAIPLPPLPASAGNNPPSTGSPPSSSHLKDAPSNQRLEEQEARIRTIEKHLHAEKQLTATLEEALVDLENQVNKFKNDSESWKKKAWDYEDELSTLRKERNANRHSLQAVEEERSARIEAEAARAHLEERMAALKKKKKSALNCF